MIDYWKRHIKELREEGVSVFFRKTRRFLIIEAKQLRKGDLSGLFWGIFGIPLILLAVPIVLLVRLFSPLILIRFGCLNSSRIGHFAGNTEMYLCGREEDRRGRTIDIFYCRRQISNNQLRKMIRRRLHICLYAHVLDLINRMIPGGEKHTIKLPSDRDLRGFYNKKPPQLSFTEKEMQRGEKGLRELGIPEDAPFVCFHVRDSAYLDSTHPYCDWHYHDYLDVRSIRTYLPAAEELTRRGYYVVRIGAVVKEALNVENPMIIDYATKYRNDFMDIYLCAACRFFLGSPSGIIQVPMSFRRPIAVANFIPFEYTYAFYRPCSFIPKKLRRRDDSRFLSFHEILDSGIGKFAFSQLYEEAGIDIIENKPEEITALAVEIDQRLRGECQTTEEDEELQRHFWSLFKRSDINPILAARIGAEFLRQNQELLHIKV